MRKLSDAALKREQRGYVIVTSISILLLVLGVILLWNYRYIAGTIVLIFDMGCIKGLVRDEMIYGSCFENPFCVPLYVITFAVYLIMILLIMIMFLWKRQYIASLVLFLVSLGFVGYCYGIVLERKRKGAREE